jgi:hypothetical protein
LPRHAARVDPDTMTNEGYSDMPFIRVGHVALSYAWSMIFSENRYPARIKSGLGFFEIMLRDE